MRPALAIMIANLLGSIPFGYLIVRATQGSDIRETGSGGTGATNVSRRAGKFAGVLTLILDVLKGAAAVWLAKLILDSQSIGASAAGWWLAVASIAVIVGHVFPVWLGFKGGKGVATGLGVFLVLVPPAVALAILLFLLIVWRTRYVSLGSIMAAVAIPIFAFGQHVIMRPEGPTTPVLVSAVVGAALIVFAHRENISRLIRGTESKFL